MTVEGKTQEKTPKQTPARIGGNSGPWDSPGRGFGKERYWRLSLKVRWGTRTMGGGVRVVNFSMKGSARGNKERAKPGGWNPLGGGREN